MNKIIINTEDIPIENIKDIIIRTNDGKYYELPRDKLICQIENVDVDLCRLLIGNFEKFFNYMKEYELQLDICETFNMDVGANIINDKLLYEILSYLNDKKYNLKLKELLINNNRITKDGMYKLIEFLHTCPNISKVYASINLLNTDDFKDCIKNAPSTIKNIIEYSAY